MQLLIAQLHLISSLENKFIKNAAPFAMASDCRISSDYFGDRVRKETGKTAQEYMQSKMIEVAKEKIFEQSKSVSQVAYESGLKYPQHFTRLFKQRVVQSPNEYRSLN